MTDQPESTLSFAQGRAILVRAAGLFRPYRRSIAIVAATIVLSSALSVSNPLLIRAIFDDALFPRTGGANVRLLLELVGAMIAVAAAASGAGVLQTYMATRIGQSVMRDLRCFRSPATSCSIAASNDTCLEPIRDRRNRT